MNKIKKIGLDFHGVIDAHPEFFSKISKNFVNSGNEIHIITGNSKNLQILDALDYYDISWTHFYSIEDDFIERKFLYKKVCKSPNDPNCQKWFDDKLWNSAKGIYCDWKQINLHYDDSEKYSDYFSTPFMLV